MCVAVAGKKKERCHEESAECRQRQEAVISQHADVIERNNQKSAIALASSAAAPVMSINICLLSSG